jgi:transcriptional regulator with XRE-family HTH domain
MSRAELVERADIPAAELEQIETGGVEATWGDLRRLAYALGVSLPALLHEVEARKSG